MVEPVNKIANSTNTNVQNDINKTVTEQKQDNKPITNNKVLMGAGAAVAIAAATIGGIMFHKSHKLTKEINTLYNDLMGRYNRAKNNEQYTRYFDPEVAIAKIKEALKIPSKKERLKELKALEKLENDRGLQVNLYREQIKPEDLPENIQQAIAEKDHLKATKLYVEYCDTLYSKSKTAGETIEESIRNVYGRPAVQPHTYTPKEGEVIATNNYGGEGFEAHVVTPQNDIADSLNHQASEGLLSGCYSVGIATRMPQGVTTPIINTGTHNGRHYVSLSIMGQRSDATRGFTLFSAKGGELTQAQKDLAGIDATKIDSEDMNLLSSLPLDGEKSNYDVILSLVQHLAQKYKA